MKTIFTKQLSLLSIFVFCIFTNAFATTYTFVGTGFIGDNFHEASSWAGGVAPPNPLPTADNIIIDADCKIITSIFLAGSGTYVSNGNITVNASKTLDIYGTLTNNSSGIITNNGLLYVQAGAYTGKLENYGEIINFNEMVNNYEINNYLPSGLITNWDIYFNNPTGITTNNSNFVNEGTLTNSNDFYNYGIFTNILTFINNDFLNNINGAGVQINNQGTITNNGNIFNSAIINNTLSGYIDNQNTIDIFFDGTLTNNNLILNNNNIYNAGNFTNSNLGNLDNTTLATFTNFNTPTSFATNFGVITNNGIINNEKIMGNTASGTFNNNNLFNNQATGLFTNNGVLSNTSDIYNNGILNNTTINAQISNSNDIYNYGTINNNATILNNLPGNIFNNSTINNNSMSEFYNNGFVYISASEQLNVNNIFENSVTGTVTIAGNFNINSPGVVTNNGTIALGASGVLQNNWDLINNNNVYTDGVINNGALGYFYNNNLVNGSQPVYDYGTIFTDASAIFDRKIFGTTGTNTLNPGGLLSAGTMLINDAQDFGRSLINMDIISAASYDIIQTTLASSLDNAIINIDLNGYNPATGDCFTLITSPTFNNINATVNYPAPLPGQLTFLPPTYVNGELIICVASAPLQIANTNFKAQLQSNNTALLQWQTESEIHNKGFEIEKSLDGISFEKIGFVESHAASNLQNNYNFTDAKTSVGKNYYRLKLIDLDNKFTYSAIEMVTVTEKANIAVYPNPATDVLNINGAAENSTIEILDMTGKKIMTNKINDQQINISALSAGQYQIKIISAENIIYQKFCKQ